MRLSYIAIGLVLSFTACSNLVVGQTVDSKLPSYKAVPGPSGQLKSVGSDTMNTLMLQWTEKFKTYYRGVRTDVASNQHRFACDLRASRLSFGFDFDGASGRHLFQHTKAWW